MSSDKKNYEKQLLASHDRFIGTSIPLIYFNSLTTLGVGFESCQLQTRMCSVLGINFETFLNFLERACQKNAQYLGHRSLY